jgi:hypothetical protein
MRSCGYWTRTLKKLIIPRKEMQILEFQANVIADYGADIVGDSSAFSTGRLISGSIARIP